MSWVSEIIERYPELQNYPQEELESIIKVFGFFYERILEEKRERERIVEDEFSNFINLLSAHQHLKIGEKVNKAKIKMRVVNTVMLNEYEYDVFTTKPQHIFFPKDFSLVSSVSYRGGLGVEAPGRLYKERVVDIAGVSFADARIRFSIDTNQQQYIDWKIWLSEAVTEEAVRIMIPSQQREYYFPSFSVEGDEIVVQNIYQITSISGGGVKAKFKTPYSLKEAVEETTEIQYSANKFTLNADLFLKDKDEVIRVSSTEEIEKMYNLRVRDKNNTYNILMVEDREFLNNIEFMKMMTQVTGKETVPAGVVVENGEVLLVFPSWVAREYGRDEVEIRLEVSADRVRDGGFARGESISNRAEVMFTIYRTDPQNPADIASVSRKGLAVEFYTTEAITFLNTPITKIHKPNRLETKTLITTEDIRNIIEKDFEVIRPLQHRTYIDELGILSDPTTFYVLIHNKKTSLRLRNSYSLEFRRRIDSVGEIGDIESSLGNVREGAIVLGFWGFRYSESKVESPPIIPITKIRAGLEGRDYYRVDNAVYFRFRNPLTQATKEFLRSVLEDTQNITRSISFYVLNENNLQSGSIMHFPIKQVERGEVNDGVGGETVTRYFVKITTEIPVFDESEAVIRDVMRKIGGTRRGVVVGTQQDNSRIAHLTADITTQITVENGLRKLITTFTYKSSDGTYVTTLYNSIQSFVSANAGRVPSVNVEVLDATDYYEDVVLSKNASRLPPFLNLGLYEIGAKEVFVKYRITFSETALVETKARIREEVERYADTLNIKSQSIEQAVNDATDKIQEFTLKDKYRKTVLDVEVDDIICFNRSQGDTTEGIRAEGIYFYRVIPIITI